MSDHTEKWRLAAARWLDLKKAAAALRECKNDTFAEIKSRQNGSSEAEKDRLARLSIEWKEYREKMLEAEDAERRAHLAVQLYRMEFDAWRTENANARSEKSSYT